MLKLQPKKILQLLSNVERIATFGLISSLIIHMGAVMVLLVSFGEKPIQIFLNNHIDGANIVLMPLVKSTHHLTRTLQYTKKNNVSPIPSTVPVTKPAPTKAATTLATMAKHAPSTKPMTSVVTHKMALKKKNIPPIKPLPVLKKQPIAKVTPEKQISRVSPPQKTSSIQTQQKKSEPIAPTQHANHFSKPSTPIVSNSASNSSPTIDEKIYVGLHEWQALQIAQDIQDGIKNVWKPPVGIVPDIACTILVTVNTQGTITQAVVQESSGVLTYDIAARNSIYEIQFPRAVWGKQVVITFDR